MLVAETNSKLSKPSWKLPKINWMKNKLMHGLIFKPKKKGSLRFIMHLLEEM
jgi:hypothetical protein